MQDNLPAQAKIEPQSQMVPQGRGQQNKYPRKLYLEGRHDGQKLIQEIVDSTTQDMGIGTDILEMDRLNLLVPLYKNLRK